MNCFLSRVLIICSILLYSFFAWQFCIISIKRNYKEGKIWTWWNFYYIGVILLGLNLIAIEIGELILYCK